MLGLSRYLLVVEGLADYEGHRRGLPGYTFERTAGDLWRSRFDALRTLLIHGARSAILVAKNKVDNTNGWLKLLITTAAQENTPPIAQAIMQ